MQMTKKISMLSLAALLTLGTIVTSGCREEGPAEKAGEKVDRTVEDMKDRAD